MFHQNSVWSLSYQQVEDYGMNRMNFCIRRLEKNNPIRWYYLSISRNASVISKTSDWLLVVLFASHKPSLNFILEMHALYSHSYHEDGISDENENKYKKYC